MTDDEVIEKARDLTENGQRPGRKAIVALLDLLTFSGCEWGCEDGSHKESCLVGKALALLRKDVE